jgi:hypothetical protein
MPQNTDNSLQISKNTTRHGYHTYWEPLMVGPLFKIWAKESPNNGSWVEKILEYVKWKLVIIFCPYNYPLIYGMLVVICWVLFIFLSSINICCFSFCWPLTYLSYFPLLIFPVLKTKYIKMDGWMDKWKNEWMERWKDGYISRWISR